MKNLIEIIQTNLAYPALQKIDPNTQQVFVNQNTPDEHSFSQAAIPAICIAMYQYVQTDEGALELLNNDKNINWIAAIFDNKKNEVVERIAAYAKQSNEDPIKKMNTIIQEAIKITKENIGTGELIIEVKNYFNNQKNNILLYLPAALNIGTLIHDSSLDDNTNKMEGPISSLMQSIGAAFSKPELDDNINKNNA
jgi:hypothetical protein